MFIRLIVTNFLSFCEPTEFNMLTGDVRTKKEHVYQHNDIEVVRAAALYGANGAGKSNMVKALSYLQDLVKGKHAPSRPFKLKAACLEEPSVFEMEFVQEGITYYYEVAVLKEVVIRESLYEIDNKQDDVLLFERMTTAGKTTIKAAEELQQSPKEQLTIELYADKLLKPTETFLGRIVADDIDLQKLRNAWMFLSNRITLVYPDTKAMIIPFLGKSTNNNLAKAIKEAVKKLDTGIVGFDSKSYSLEKYFGKDDESLVNRISTLLEEQEEDTSFMTVEKEYRDLMFSKRQGKYYVDKLVFKHRNEKEEDCTFELQEESDGTQRILDILVNVQVAVYTNKIVIIDEIDRSIHSSLTKAILKSFMNAKQTKGQLIFTTHEANLLDLNIFRQDEIWFAEKNKKGATTLYPLSDFKVRSDLSIKKGYLNGRFGAIPFLGDFEALNWSGGDHSDTTQNQGEVEHG